MWALGMKPLSQTCPQYDGGTTTQMLAEALTFGKKAGLEWKQMLDIISASVVGSPLVNYKAVRLKIEF